MKNKILKAVSYIAGMGFIVAGSCLDSLSLLPPIICSVCLLWLVLFFTANREVIK